MPRVVLTDKLIARTKAPRSGTAFLWDAVVPGLGVRVHPSGRKNYVLQYRLPSEKQRRIGLGLRGLRDLDEVREIARERLRQISRGEDHEGEQTRNTQINTIEAIWANFLHRHLEAKERSDSYIAHSKGHFRRYVLPRWRGRDIRSIARKDVIALLDRIVDQGKGVTANRVLALLGRLFAWCVERDLLENNPAARLAKPAAEHRRERVLDDREVAAVWQTALRLRYPWGPFFRLLILTGQRRSEVACMKWSDVNLVDAEWALSAEQTKSARFALVPLARRHATCFSTFPVSLGRLRFSPRHEAARLETLMTQNG